MRSLKTVKLATENTLDTDKPQNGTSFKSVKPMAAFETENSDSKRVFLTESDAAYPKVYPLGKAFLVKLQVQ